MSNHQFIPMMGAYSLLEVIGEEATFNLLEEYGGLRVYFPQKVEEGADLVASIGMDAAKVLSNLFAPDIMKIPLCRAFRASVHRARGLSNAQVARRLGMTETGVETLFRRLRAAGQIVPERHVAARE